MSPRHLLKGAGAGYVLISLLAILTAATEVWAQDCRRNATLLRDTQVFSQPATSFNTASGWVYGPSVAVLGRDVRVQVCSDRTVRFGVISQNWSEIAYWDGT